MPLEYSPVFEQAWALYPKRRGPNPKSEAWKQWQARVREGVVPFDMIQATRRYAQWCDQERKTGTELVMQARRFYGKAREFAEVEQWQSGIARAPEPEVDIKRAVGMVQARRAHRDGDEWWAQMIKQADGAGRYRSTRDLFLYAAEQLEEDLKRQHQQHLAAPLQNGGAEMSAPLTPP